MFWIKVDQQPPPRKWVLAYPTMLNGVALAMLLNNGKWMNAEHSEWWQPPTHWMPLPEPPKESE